MCGWQHTYDEESSNLSLMWLKSICALYDVVVKDDRCWVCVNRFSDTLVYSHLQDPSHWLLYRGDQLMAQIHKIAYYLVRQRVDEIYFIKKAEGPSGYNQRIWPESWTGHLCTVQTACLPLYWSRNNVLQTLSFGEKKGNPDPTQPNNTNTQTQNE